MDELIEQLKNDISEYFKSDDEYPNILVKDVYELYPEITYPAITIEEIENEEDNQYTDETERVTKLAYQFNLYSEQSLNKTAVQNVRNIARKLDEYFKGPRYRCLRRLGSIAIAPSTTDDNVMIGYLRYECHLERDTHTIYRRY